MEQVSGMGMEQVEGVGGVILAVSIVMALVNCFFGYKLEKFWIALVCFCIGALGGGIVSGVLLHQSATVTALAAVVLGVVLSLLSFKLYLAGVFVFSGGITLWACVLLLRNPIWLGWAVGVLAGVLIGILAVKFTRPVMILTTSIGGGLAAAKSLFLLLPASFSAWAGWLPLVVGVVLAVLGLFVQINADKKRYVTEHTETGR